MQVLSPGQTDSQVNGLEMGAKRIHKSMQVCKTRTCVRTCEGWPYGFTSQRKFAKPELAYGLAKGVKTDSQVNASLQNQNLRMDLRWVAKRIHKSTQVCKTRTCVRTCDGWPNGLTSRCKFATPELAYGLEMGGKTDSQVNASLQN